MKLAEDVVERLRRIRVPTNSTFDDGQAQAPDVALHAVRSTAARSGLLDTATGNPFGGHVALTANIRLGDAGDEVAADAKVADLDLPPRVDQDIRRLHVAVDDVVVVLQGLQSHDRRQGHLPEDVLGNAAFVEFVDRTAIHILHADVDGPFLEEGTVEVDNEGGHATVQDVQLHEDLGKFALV